MKIKDLLNYADDFLDAGNFKDVSLNGLQVEGIAECTRIATAATASLEAIRAAAEHDVDALLVHHGLLWKKQCLPVSGVFKERLFAILEANMNLIAYHLPLDANYELGNNRCLCELLDMGSFDYVQPDCAQSVAMKGELREPASIAEIAARLASGVNNQVRVIGAEDEERLLKTAAVCSGSGSFLLDENPRPDFEALVTGDINEQTFHNAAESGTVVFVLGHHASEQEGICRLGDKLAARFSLEHVNFRFYPEKNSRYY